MRTPTWHVGEFILLINEKKNPGKSIDIWLIYGFVKIWP